MTETSPRRGLPDPSPNEVRRELEWIAKELSDHFQDRFSHEDVAARVRECYDQLDRQAHVHAHLVALTKKAVRERLEAELVDR